MLTSLFSMFDPASNLMSLSPNWIMIFMIPVFRFGHYFVVTNSHTLLAKNFHHNAPATVIKPALNMTPSISFTLISIYSILLILNCWPSVPYFFCNSSHLVVTLSLSLPMWLAMMILSLTSNTGNFLAHLIPTNTPLILTPFMMMVEMLSHLIRPMTLAIRLMTNMMAGHLLIQLVDMAAIQSPLMTLNPIYMLMNSLLSTLETVIPFIQTYVFFILLTLYAEELSS